MSLPRATSQEPRAPAGGTPALPGAYWLAFLLLCPVFWWGCWGAPFSRLDDAAQIAANPTLQAGAPWRDIWFGGVEKDVECFYLPLTDTWLRLHRVVFVPLLKGLAGDNAWAAGLRTTNVFLHVLAALLVWLLARRLGLSRAWAGFTTALFAIHPIHCNTVCWCVEQKTLLAAVFGFAAVLTYLRARNWRHYSLAALLYACALLSKAAALGLLPVVVLWELFGRPGEAEDMFDVERVPRFRPLWRVAARLAPWIVLSLVALRINLLFAARGTLPPPGGSIYTAGLTAVGVVWRYVLNLLCPVRLSFDYAIPVVDSVRDGRLWLAAAALSGVVLATLLLARRGTRAVVCFAWLWFVAAMAPTLNFVGKNNLMSDCYVYFSAPAFWMAVALALQGAVSRVHLAQRRWPSWLAPALLALPVIPAAVATAYRSALYADPRFLLESSARNEPDSSLNHLVLAQVLHEDAAFENARGNTAAAAALLKRECAELEAGIAGMNFDRTLLMSSAYGFLGESYFAHGRLDEAEAMLQRALVAPPLLEPQRRGRALAFLGLIAIERKQYRRALECFEQAGALAPDKTKLQLYRAKTLLLLQQQAPTAGEAWRHYRAARELLDQVPASSPFYSQVDAMRKAMKPPEGGP